jgi:hypothetical protein
MLTLSLNGNVADKMTRHIPSTIAGATCKDVSTALIGIAAYGDHFHACQLGQPEM